MQSSDLVGLETGVMTPKLFQRNSHIHNYIDEKFSVLCKYARVSLETSFVNYVV